QIMKDKNITEALRFTSVLSDGKEMIAIRYSSDESAPSLYFKQYDDHIVVGSEPLESSTKDWNLVPAGHFMKIENMAHMTYPIYP
ncbi:class II glutamine amidotransferase, partial [Marinomonas sp.]|nr:class II glutamine amidotransferase [Marinomonas sp.]